MQQAMALPLHAGERRSRRLTRARARRALSLCAVIGPNPTPALKFSRAVGSSAIGGDHGAYNEFGLWHSYGCHGLFSIPFSARSVLASVKISTLAKGGCEM